MGRYVQHVENVVSAAAITVSPAVHMLQGPISVVDRIMCHSIDFVEQRLPDIYQSHQLVSDIAPRKSIRIGQLARQMYTKWIIQHPNDKLCYAHKMCSNIFSHLHTFQIMVNTREFMSDRVVRPVLKRADSVKAIRDAMLDSQVSVYAAHRIGGAIDVADKYVERFLPDANGVDCTDADSGCVDQRLTSSRPVHTMHKGQLFSKKLKRRLTQRTMIEARALQNGSREAVHFVRYACELIVRDPRQACRRAAELWQYLSGDEPDNQARPQTLEQLIVLMVRESARKGVHLTNLAVRVVARIPRFVVRLRRAIVGLFHSTTHHYQ